MEKLEIDSESVTRGKGVYLKGNTKHGSSWEDNSQEDL